MGVLSATDRYDLSLMLGGPLYQLYRRTHLAGDALELLRRRVLAIALIAWVPLLLLSLVEGHAWGGVKVPFLLDIEMHVRLLIVILGSTHHRAPVGFAGIAIGLALTLIHLISIPVTNTSVNPARSTGPALFVGGWALSQLWVFWLAPIAGALAAGWLYKGVLEFRAEPDIAGRP